jgi:hypothetical protein
MSDRLDAKSQRTALPAASLSEGIFLSKRFFHAEKHYYTYVDAKDERNTDIERFSWSKGMRARFFEIRK